MSWKAGRENASEGVVFQIGNLWDCPVSRLVEMRGGESPIVIVGLVQFDCYTTDHRGSRLLKEFEANPHEMPTLSNENSLIELPKHDPEPVVVVLR